jgi:hypothetical protein
MGCRLLLRALTDIETDARKWIKSVTFASPDVDSQMFSGILEECFDKMRDCRFLVDRSTNDLALEFSRFLHGADRAGLTLDDLESKGTVSGARYYDGSGLTHDPKPKGTVRVAKYYDDLLNIGTNHFDFLYMNGSIGKIAENITNEAVSN